MVLEALESPSRKLRQLYETAKEKDSFWRRDGHQSDVFACWIEYAIEESIQLEHSSEAKGPPPNYAVFEECFQNRALAKGANLGKIWELHECEGETSGFENFPP